MSDIFWAFLCGAMVASGTIIIVSGHMIRAERRRDENMRLTFLKKWLPEID